VNYAETYKHSETTCRKMSEKRIGKPTWNKGLTANEDSRILAGENSPSYGKVYQTKQTHPEWAAKIKKSTKGKINLGDTNAMTRPDVQAKMSASRKKRLANDPELCQRISAYVKAAWADGKFDGVRVGQCKWFTYVKQDGTSVKLQGTWELAFAKWMDENNVKFVAHRTWVPYKDEQGNVHLYYPDFYVETWGEWVDVKNDYHWGLQKDKFDCIRRSNPSMRIRVILKKELEELGVSL
jgi:hypothetical protein